MYQAISRTGTRERRTEKLFVGQKVQARRPHALHIYLLFYGTGRDGTWLPHISHHHSL